MLQFAHKKIAFLKIICLLIAFHVLSKDAEPASTVRVMANNGVEEVPGFHPLGPPSSSAAIYRIQPFVR